MNKVETPPITKILYFVGAVLIILGIGITVRLAIANSERDGLKNVYTPIEAHVDTVDSVYSGHHYEKVVKGHYTVDGEDYNVTFEDYPATVQEGDKLTVYYDPDNPGTIIHNPGRGTSLGANLIALVIIVAGFIAVFYGSKMKRNNVDIEIESRYKSYEEYGGETTERSGTLFDHEINPADLRLNKPKPVIQGRAARRAERISSLFQPKETDYAGKYAALLRDHPGSMNGGTSDGKPTPDDYIHEYTQSGNPTAAKMYEQQNSNEVFGFYQSPEEPSGGNTDPWKS